MKVTIEFLKTKKFVSKNKLKTMSPKISFFNKQSESIKYGEILLGSQFGNVGNLFNQILNSLKMKYIILLSFFIGLTVAEIPDIDNCKVGEKGVEEHIVYVCFKDGSKKGVKAIS